MNRIKTDTTSFKRSLKTITDMLTATESKEHDIDIQFNYNLGIASMLAQHPVDDIIVKSIFIISDSTDEEFSFSIKLGGLSELLKKYRKKEVLFITLKRKGVSFSTETDNIYETNKTDYILEKREFDNGNGITVNRKHLVDSLNLSRSINRSTFHDSSMVVKFAYTGKELLLYATNFAQILVSSIVAETTKYEVFDINLPTSLLTKVRNTINRGTGANVVIRVENNWLTIHTDSNTVQFKNEVDLKYIHFNSILSGITWDEKVYSFNTNKNKDVLNIVYSKLRESEDNKEEELINLYNNVYFELTENEMVFSEEEQKYSLFTRDVNSFINRLPNELDIALSDNALLFKHDYKHGRVMLLTPYNKL